MSKPRLRSLQLVNYKGFERHTVHFSTANALVGANNAGKSTVLAALKLLASMIPTARRLNPRDMGSYQGSPTRGWRVTAAALESAGFSAENVRHDFRPDESRIELKLSTDARVAITWDAIDPADDETIPRGTFFVFPPSGQRMTARAAAQSLLPDIGVVPPLTPLDDHEDFVRDETLRRNISSRRFSRYFRNALHRLDRDQWLDFTQFVYERTPEIQGLDLRRSIGDTSEFDLFFSELQSRNEREIAWAGDGIQIWLQDLYHVWLFAGRDVLILDEPDVFLHPDLQRRLARLLFSSAPQVVIATHSAEILAEAPPASAVWIDRARRTSERPKKDGALGLMGRRLGSAFELGVGRALRSRTVLFVEGDDSPLLSAAAAKLGFERFASSDNYATVPLGGFSRNSIAGAFAEATKAIGAEVSTYIILDSDLKTESELADLLVEVKRQVGAMHVWKRRELENYILSAQIFAAALKLPDEEAEERLDRAIWSNRDEALLELQAVRVRDAGRAGKHPKTLIREAATEFNKRWEEPEGRASIVDAKAVIRHVNRELQQDGKKKSANAMKLFRSITVETAPPELVQVLNELEELLSRR